MYGEYMALVAIFSESRPVVNRHCCGVVATGLAFDLKYLNQFQTYSLQILDLF